MMGMMPALTSSKGKTKLNNAYKSCHLQRVLRFEKHFGNLSSLPCQDQRCKFKMHRLQAASLAWHKPRFSCKDTDSTCLRLDLNSSLLYQFSSHRNVLEAALSANGYIFIVFTLQKSANAINQGLIFSFVDGLDLRT